MPPATSTVATTVSGPGRRVVVVLGMHRSGTSAVAGCLQRMGVDFGPRLMPATADNPRGYYEHIDLVNLHDRLLLSMGRSWDDAQPMPPEGWQDSAASVGYREEARELLQRDFADQPIWGFKDPRLCRLLPWWEPLWRETNSLPLFVLVRRPPLEVVDSLARREGFSAGKSFLLWLRHVLEAECRTRGHTRVLVDFREFLDDWRTALRPVVQALGAAWPAPADMPGPGDQQTFVEPALARSAPGDMTIARTVPRWVESVDAALRAGLKGDEGGMRGELDQISSHLVAAESLFGVSRAEDRADLQHQIESVRRQAAWYEAEWRKCHARAEHALEKLAVKRREIGQLKERLIKKDK